MSQHIYFVEFTVLIKDITIEYNGNEEWVKNFYGEL